MKCPIDNSYLNHEVYEDSIKVFKCPTCSGICLRRAELEEIQASQENDYSDELNSLTDLGYNAYQLASQKIERVLHCPSCDNEMESREYARCSQVMIDVCPKCHSIWLDKDELKNIEVFFETAKSDRTAKKYVLLKKFFAQFNRGILSHNS